MRRGLFFALGGLVGVVCLQNWEPTALHLLFWTLAEVPKVILLGATFGLGLLVGWGWAKWDLRP